MGFLNARTSCWRTRSTSSSRTSLSRRSRERSLSAFGMLIRCWSRGRSIQADSYSPEELEEFFKRFEIKATITGNDLTKPYPFNLMFATNIGPEGNSVVWITVRM